MPGFTQPLPKGQPQLPGFTSPGGRSPVVGGAAGAGAAPGRSVNPDYLKILGGDSILSAGLAGLGFDMKGNLSGTGQASILRAGLTNSRNAALENFGAVPDFSQSAAAAAGFTPKDIDQTTRLLAAQNPNSVLSQLGRDYKDANSTGLAQLAAHGILHSGATGQTENENLAAYNQNTYNAGQQLLDKLGGYQSDYQTGLQGLQGQRQDLVNQALTRVITGINADQYGPTTTTPKTKTVTNTTTKPAAPHVTFHPYGSAAQRNRQAL